VAAFGAILNNRLTAELKDALASAHVRPPAGGSGLGSPEQVHHLPEPFKQLVLESFTRALESVFLVGIPVAAVGFVAVLALKELPLRGSGKTKKDAEAPGTPVAGRHARGPQPPVPPVPPSEQELVSVGAANGVTGMSRAEEAVPITVPMTAPSPNGLAAPTHAPQLFDQRNALVEAQAQTQPPAPEPGGQIRGFVRGGDGSPVQAAALTLIDVTGHQLGRAITGDDGAYAMPTPGPGTYVLIAAAGDHEPQAATLVVGDAPLDFDLLLAGNGGLAGRVRGKDGTPIEGAMVVVTDVRGEVVGTVRTGADGGYALKDVVSGSYTIAVSAAGHRPAAAPVRIAGSGQTRHDVELLPGAAVRGTVRNASGEPIGDARVTLVDGAGNVVAMVITGPDGEYAFADLTGGQYTVIASGYPPVATALSLAGGGLDGHDLRLGFPEE
jgi:hypothetical protein